MRHAREHGRDARVGTPTASASPIRSSCRATAPCQPVRVQVCGIVRLQGLDARQVVGHHVGVTQRLSPPAACQGSTSSGSDVEHGVARAAAASTRRPRRPAARHPDARRRPPRVGRPGRPPSGCRRGPCVRRRRAARSGPASGSAGRTEAAGWSDTDRVPDRLGLEEPGQPGDARVGGPVHGSGSGRSTRLRLSAAAISSSVASSASVDAGQVDGVDVHVRGQPGGDLGGAAGQHVDDSARHVGGGEHLRERDGRQRRARTTSAPRPCCP